jgi:hypothetical protein
MQVHLIVLVLSFLVLSCASAPKKVNMKVQTIAFENLPFLDEAQKIKLGGFSSLHLLKKEDNKLFFRTITDRGPNLEETEVEIDGEKLKARPFLIPNYVPQVVDFTLDLTTKKIEVIKQYELKNKNGSKASGLPLANPVAEKNETAIDLNNEVLESVSFGLDSEGYAAVIDMHLVADEYGPSLYLFNSDFKLVNSFTADSELPEDFKLRKINRGFEALASDGQYAYAMLQSPLVHDKNKIRIIQFDVKAAKTTKQFLYPIESKQADKIGDIAFSTVAQKLLVLEQNGKLGAEKGVRRIYSVNLNSQTEVLDKTLVVDLAVLGVNQFEKLEGLAVIDSKTLAVIIDNDFGLDGVFDTKTSTYKVKEDPKSYLILISSTKDLF